MFFLLLLFFFGFIFLLSSRPTYAATKTWNPAGCGSTSWNTGANWSGGLPGTGDVATFDGATSNCQVTVDTSVDVDGINIINSYTGTITQGNGNDINVRGSGFTQNAAGSTFTGGDATSDLTLDSSGGAFTLTTGIFNAPAGLTIFSGDYTYSAGTFNPNGGTVKFLGKNSSYTLTGSTTFNNLIIDDQASNFFNTSYTIAGGTTFTVNGALTFQNAGSGGGTCSISGAITAKGDITIAGSGSPYDQDGCAGDAVVTVNGSGTQTITGTADDHHYLPGLIINKLTGTLNFVNSIAIDEGSWTYTAGTLNMGTSRIIFKCNAGGCAPTITGSMTFYQLTFDESQPNGFQATYSLASGTNLTVTNTLTFTNAGNSSGSCGVDGPGGIYAQGDITLTGDGCSGEAVITINGNGTQTITGEVSTTLLPALNIDKTGGVLNLAGIIGVDSGWSYTKGSVNPGTSTIVMSATTDQVTVNLSGSMEFNNLTFDQEVCNTCGAQYSISSGTVLTINGTLKFDNSNSPSSFYAPNVDGPGTLLAKGDLITLNVGGRGDVAITLSGGNSQTITASGTDFPTGTFTINKTAGTVTLGSDFNPDASGQDVVISGGVLSTGVYNLTVADVLTISGQLIQGDGSITADSVSIGSKGAWTNNSNGDFTLGAGGLANAGYLRFDGSGPQCGGSDTIAITSSSGGAARSWTGAGTFNINDVTVSDQNGSITAYNSTLSSNSNWTFNPGCPAYSARSTVKVNGKTKITGGAKLKSL